MDLKQFSVVYFPFDNAIEVVPSIWVSVDQTKCQFPSRTYKGFKKIQKNPASPPSPSWPSWDVEIKKTYGM